MSSYLGRDLDLGGELVDLASARRLGLHAGKQKRKDAEMNDERADRMESASDGQPTEQERVRVPWTRPLVTRLSLDRTLFSRGSPIDGAMSGSGTPV